MTLLPPNMEEEIEAKIVSWGLSGEEAVRLRRLTRDFEEENAEMMMEVVLRAWTILVYEKDTRERREL